MTLKVIRLWQDLSNAFRRSFRVVSIVRLGALIGGVAQWLAEFVA